MSLSTWAVCLGLTMLSCGLQMKSVLTFDFEKMSYFPPIFFNDFWLLRDYLVPMNKSVTEVPLHFSVSGLSSIKFMLYTQAEQSFKMQVQACTPTSYHSNLTCQENAMCGQFGYGLSLGHVEAILTERPWHRSRGVKCGGS